MASALASAPVLAAGEEEDLICVFCGNTVSPSMLPFPSCSNCLEYKGLMTVEAWEAYTGEEW